MFCIVGVWGERGSSSYVWKKFGEDVGVRPARGVCRIWVRSGKFIAIVGTLVSDIEVNGPLLEQIDRILDANTPLADP